VSSFQHATLMIQISMASAVGDGLVGMKTRWEEALSHSVMVSALSFDRRGIGTVSTKRLAAGKLRTILLQTVNENGNQAWMKKSGNHFVVTVYRVQSVVVICHLKKRHI
jgi:hypothetical protein